ncbi:MAG: GntR family transcriptional regulator [Clostridiales bacterium]|nr:GntR family transcriptional regulator [Clostridiales bacterium]
MIISMESTVPIYIQIAQGIENDIINGILIENESAYSQYQISREYQINPATAAKGINILVQEGILFKKRGLGMFVSIGAGGAIKRKRKEIFFNTTIDNFMQEAKKLSIDKKELKRMIDEYEEE